MRSINFEEYVSIVDNFKRQHRRLDTNNFFPSVAFKELLGAKECELLETNECILVSVPMHDGAFNQLYYLAAGGSGIDEALRALEEKYDKQVPIACTVIGKEAYVEKTIQLFLNNGYCLHKKMRRFDYLNSTSFITTENISAEFAHKEDAKEILKMFLSFMDIYYVPELSEIIQNIEKEQIAIVRLDNKIAAFKYFERHESVISYTADYARPEYRKNRVFYQLAPFIAKSFKGKGIRQLRAYGWRDMDNEKLTQFAIRQNEIPQDMVFYTVINSFEQI